MSLYDDKVFVDGKVKTEMEPPGFKFNPLPQ